MFERMIESAPARRRSAAQVVVSVAVHAGLVVVAVRATSAVAAPGAERPRPDTLIWTTDPAPPATTPRARPGPAEGDLPRHSPETRGPPRVPDFNAPEIPPLHGRLTEEAGQSVELMRRQLRAGPGAGAGGVESPPDSSRVFGSADLDRGVEVIEQPAPAYPPALRAAGVRGYADLEFVVGSDGRVEAGSVVIRGASHAAFGESARDAIVVARFRPAMLRGRAVRQLVRQRIRFDLTTAATAPTSS
jgi:protein TonB